MMQKRDWLPPILAGVCFLVFGVHALFVGTYAPSKIAEKPFLSLISMSARLAALSLICLIVTKLVFLTAYHKLRPVFQGIVALLALSVLIMLFMIAAA